jgi:hypothetical protein
MQNTSPSLKLVKSDVASPPAVSRATIEKSLSAQIYQITYPNGEKRLALVKGIVSLFGVTYEETVVIYLDTGSWDKLSRVYSYGTWHLYTGEVTIANG